MEPVTIGTKKKSLAIRAPYGKENLAKCRGIPTRRLWDPASKAWVCQASLANIGYLTQAFPLAVWTTEANALRTVALEKLADRERAREEKAAILQEDPDLTDYKFLTDPYAHQARSFALSRDRETFALFMEMGTGKTKVIIDSAAWLYLQDKIGGVLVVCPNSVKRTWEDEVETHLPTYVPRAVHVYRSGASKAERVDLELLLAKSSTPSLRFLVMNVEAFSTKGGEELAKRFLAPRSTLMVVDESSRIKTPSAKRTKSVIRTGKSATYRRILTGTPVTQGPLDLFSQFAFLDKDILGFGSMYAFRNHFAVMGGFQGREVLGYANLDELHGLTDPVSYRVTKEECLDLPPKSYSRRVVKLSKEQRSIYDAMAQDMVAEWGGVEFSATIVLTQLLRLQQITGGFVPNDQLAKDLGLDHIPIPGTNHKLEALLDLAEEVQGKMIVWARFRPELALIQEALADRFGESGVSVFHGGVSEADRDVARRSFQDPSSPVRFFIANAQTGGLGLTLTQAKTVVYYSNTFSLEDRLQSEDRAHRVGLKHPVTYVDLVAEETLDMKLLKTLRSKKNVADMITGDNLREWI